LVLLLNTFLPGLGSPRSVRVCCAACGVFSNLRSNTPLKFWNMYLVCSKQNDEGTVANPENNMINCELKTWALLRQSLACSETSWTLPSLKINQVFRFCSPDPSLPERTCKTAFPLARSTPPPSVEKSYRNCKNRIHISYTRRRDDQRTNGLRATTPILPQTPAKFHPP
jgi:hypothetical protein